MLRPYEGIVKDQRLRRRARFFFFGRETLALFDLAMEVAQPGARQISNCAPSDVFCRSKSPGPSGLVLFDF